jgi:hypothetical protein
MPARSQARLKALLMTQNEAEAACTQPPRREVSRIAFTGFVVALISLVPPFFVLPFVGILAGLISLAGAVHCIVRHRKVRGFGLGIAGMVVSFEYLFVWYQEYIMYYVGRWACCVAFLFPVILMVGMMFWYWWVLNKSRCKAPPA